MKTLGQYSWKPLIRSWPLVELHCPSLIKIVSDRLQSSRVGFLDHHSKHSALSILLLQRNLVNSKKCSLHPCRGQVSWWSPVRLTDRGCVVSREARRRGQQHWVLHCPSLVEGPPRLADHTGLPYVDGSRGAGPVVNALDPRATWARAAHAHFYMGFFYFFICRFLKISFLYVFSLMISLITLSVMELTLLEECNIYTRNT